MFDDLGSNAQSSRGLNTSETLRIIDFDHLSGALQIRTFAMVLQNLVNFVYQILIILIKYLSHHFLVQLTNSSTQYLANVKCNLGIFPYYFFEFLLMED